MLEELTLMSSQAFIKKTTLFNAGSNNTLAALYMDLLGLYKGIKISLSPCTVIM